MAGSRWVKLDVDYFANPKALAAGRNGRDLHLASICWVARYLTDGFVPADAVKSIAADAGLNGPRDAVDRVVSAGLWIPNGHGYDIKDYVETNGSRADVERARDLYRIRQRRYRERRET